MPRRKNSAFSHLINTFADCLFNAGGLFLLTHLVRNYTPFFLQIKHVLINEFKYLLNSRKQIISVDACQIQLYEKSVQLVKSLQYRRGVSVPHNHRCSVAFHSALVLSDSTVLQFSGKGPLQQGLLQFVQCGYLLLVDGFESLGFGEEGVEAGDDGALDG